MRIAICSLSTFTYVAECVDAAVVLARSHDVRFMLGFRSAPAIALLERRGLAYEVLLDEPLVLAGAAAARSAHELFTDFFFRQAEAAMPRLVARLERWGAELVLSHLRDFAGINAAAVVGVPVISFGSHANPVRCEPSDPPFGSGLYRTAPAARRQLMWQFDREFHEGLDPIYNRTFRQPYGLPPVHRASTHASERLILLSLIPALGNANAPVPAHVRFVGPLFANAGASAGPDERALLEHIAASPRPRVFISLGTTYGASLVHDCLDALEHFDGTVVASGTPAVRTEPGLICTPFFEDVHAALGACDAAVTVCGGKTVMDLLVHGLPIVGLPRQGEQKDVAVALQAHGAALLPCLRKWEPAAFRAAVASVCRDDAYRTAATRLRAEVVSSGGAAYAAEEVLRAVAAH